MHKVMGQNLETRFNGALVPFFRAVRYFHEDLLEIWLDITITGGVRLSPFPLEVLIGGRVIEPVTLDWSIEACPPDRYELRIRLCVPAPHPARTAFDFGKAKTFPGRLRGYRYFRLYSNLNLHSVSHRDAWDDREKVAQCAGYTGIHTAPQPRCRCGIYGWYAPELATENHGNFSLGLGHGIRDRLVLGAVSVSGNIVPGTDGFRAERAKIEALVLPGNFHYFAGREKEFQERYSGIQVFNHLDDLVEAFSPSDVSELMS